MKMIIPDLDVMQMKKFTLQKGQGKLAIFEFNVPENAKQGQYLVAFHIRQGNEQAVRYTTFEVA